FERHGDKVLLRDLGSADGSQVNGVSTRHCWLQAGDQVVFEGNHRFVLEIPLGPASAGTAFPVEDDEEPVTLKPSTLAPAKPKLPRRWPWLLLSALLLGSAISALLLFGAR
ncbi:MAG: FHA domain-containing protein, partial [Stenotrophomonas sp.]